MVSAIIVAQAAVRASGARRRLVLGIQHQTSYPAALHKASLQNLLGLLDGAIVIPDALRIDDHRRAQLRSEEHTSELQSLMRISYAVFCLKQKKRINRISIPIHHHYHTY